MEIRRFKYGADAYAEYVYIPKENVCVYTGVSNAIRHPTTAKEAVNILFGIAQELGQPVENIRFFELSTHREWPYLSPGTYNFKKVTIWPDKQPVDVGWSREDPCPPEILEAFLKNIGGDPAALRRFESPREDDILFRSNYPS